MHAEFFFFLIMKDGSRRDREKEIEAMNFLKLREEQKKRFVCVLFCV